jgi:hypothetical protein
LPWVFFIILVARVRNPRFGVRGAQVKSQVYLSFYRAPQGEGVSRHPSSPANVLKLKDPVGLFLIQYKDE